MFKKNQAVKTNRNGVQNTGKFVAEHKGTKGSFYEVLHDDGTTKKYRAAQIEAA